VFDEVAAGNSDELARADSAASRRKLVNSRLSNLTDDGRRASDRRNDDLVAVGKASLDRQVHAGEHGLKIDTDALRSALNDYAAQRTAFLDTASEQKGIDRRIEGVE